MNLDRFRRGPVAASFAGVIVAGAFGGSVACGGSASESPWPVEPLDAETGPRGEALPGTEASDLMADGPTPSAGTGGSSAGELEPIGGGP